MRVVGLDIGGANLKAADAEGRALTRPFAVWKNPDRLAAEVDRLLAGFPKPDLIAVTMTAELADCYRSKREGVDAIVSAVELAAGGVPVWVWQTSGCLVSPREARATPALTAAANWHALATFVGLHAPDGGALLIDIGTTTCDLIPLEGGRPVAVGRTDRERLQSGELVYSGVRRTPVCAVVGAVAFRGGDCAVMAELFATTLDVYLTTGELLEDPTDLETADGRPATMTCARDRLARCIGCDSDEFTQEDAEVAAEGIAAAQRRQIGRALDAVLGSRPSPPARVFLSGVGGFLARQIVQNCPQLAEAQTVSLLEIFGPGVTEAACAFAVARLAAEQNKSRSL
ncbi:MAG TPA: hydantoinase/oxoprolinase family protein [Planctomycetaceae bacterium]|nr:hydantoinase/oxoprolinase family protein [Planctomycetaceae bacterium]